MQSIKITTADTAPTAAFIPVAELFLAQGDVIVSCDGAAALLWGRWEENHTQTNGSIHPVGIYHRFSPEYKPLWQLTGASANTELELNALVYARSMGVKTAVYIDIDGAHRRFPETVDFVDLFLAATESVRQEILRDYPSANISVTGTPSARVVQQNKETLSSIQANGFTKETTVTWAAGGTLSDLQLIVDSLMTDMEDCALVMGLHPDPTKVANIDSIIKISNPLREQGRLLWDPQNRQNPLNIPGNTVEKALASAVTIGASSLVLDEIAYNGGKVVSVTNTETTGAFEKVCTEVAKFPCVAAGRAVPVSNPCDFRRLVFPDVTEVQKTMLPYSPEAVLGALGF